MLASLNLAAEPLALRPSIESLAHACAACHGTHGHAQTPTPSIAGLPEAEFVRFMEDFRSGKRTSSIMNRIAQGYTSADMVGLAQFFARK
jgi:sulfide dehydrogenase cytochrome subunit